ncbi:MAG: DUF3039 domain-containing protein [Acidimicrobiia bacterium]
MSEPDTRTVSRSRPRTSTGDDEGQAHIVMKGDQMRGYLTGEAIMALCGKVWVPSRDYRGLPVCPVCADERDRLVAGMGNLN